VLEQRRLPDPVLAAEYQRPAATIPDRSDEPIEFPAQLPAAD
jgi:hypothetical protein